jgi:MFS family permease
LYRLFLPIFDSLRSFKGNARACILVEPLWGIPYNLFVPYASLYMLALGVTESGIGLMAAIGMGLQMLWSLVGGWVTNRFGRRRTSLVFDLMSWTIPTLLWAFAQDFRWFLVAAILNSLVRIVHISWSCLFVEDAAVDTRVHLYAWIAVAGTLSGFFAPLAGLLVGRIGLVPATRILYGIAFVSMTTMFLLRNAFTIETRIGRIKMAEARFRSPRQDWEEYILAIRTLAGSRAAKVAFFLAVLSYIHLMVRTAFLSITLTKGIGLSPSIIAAFPPMASAVTLLTYFLLIPRVRNIRRALFMALGTNMIGNLIIFSAPYGSVMAVVVGTLVVALGTGITGPVVEAVLANSLKDDTRATALSIVYTLMFAVSAPFGWVAGRVAEAGARLPVLLAAGIMLLSALLALSVDHERRQA